MRRMSTKQPTSVNNTVHTRAAAVAAAVHAVTPAVAVAADTAAILVVAVTLVVAAADLDKLTVDN